MISAGFASRGALHEAREESKRWTAGQAARLQTEPAVILGAVQRGWLPEQIEGVDSKYALEDTPPVEVIRFKVIH